MMSKSNRRTFIAFACTYFAVITLVLLALSPIYLSLIRAEREKLSQSIDAYARSIARELEATEDFLLYTSRNVYTDQELQRLYYDSTRRAGTTLFYDMNQLQDRLKLYFQNIQDVRDVIVYIPKFDYVLTQQYIFRSRTEFYECIDSAAYRGEDWLEKFLQPEYNTTVVSDQITDLLHGTESAPVMNHLFAFPMVGDSNIRLLIMVSLDAPSIASHFLLPELQGQGYVTITDQNGIHLAESATPASGSAPSPQQTSDYHFQLALDKGRQVSIEVNNSFFNETRREILLLILKNIGISLILSACTALYFAWNRSRPIERILHIIRKASVADGDVTKLGELEDVVVNMAAEIHQCKLTIKDLDSIVNNSLLDRLFFGEFEQPKLQETFVQCYGPMPASCLVVIFGSETPPFDGNALSRYIREELRSFGLEVYVIYFYKENLYLLLEGTPDIREVLESLLKTVREQGLGIIKAGLSNPIASLSYVKEGTLQAQRRLNSGIHIHGVYLFAHTYSSKVALNPLSLQSLDMLSKALLTWDVQTTNRTLEEILSHLEPSRLDAVELRQLFFSLRAIYSTVINQFVLDADAADVTIGEDFFLPNDLDEYNIETIRTVFTNLNTALYAHDQKRNDKKARIKGMDILAYVEENFRDSNLCANSIAAHFHVSEKYVFQLVKKACGKTLNDKISFMRVQEGIRLLETTDMTVSEIALAIGFTSSNSMYKVFMRVNGISPSSYRKR